jgi:hypothetical protein
MESLTTCRSLTFFVLQSLVQTGKISDYTRFFTKGTSIQFWWDEEQGWLHATLLKDIERSLSRGMIRWQVKMKFAVDQNVHSHSFHPKDARWKIKIEKDTGKADNAKTSKKAKVENKTKAKGGAPVKKSVKKVKKASEKKAASFTIPCDSDLEEDTDTSGKSKANQKSASKEVVPTVTPTATTDSGVDKRPKRKPGPIDLGLLVKKSDKQTKSKPGPIDLGLLEKKESKASSGKVSGAVKVAEKPTESSSMATKNVKAKCTQGGDPIFIAQAKPSVATLVQTSNIKPATTFKKLPAQATVPASKFHAHMSTKKSADPFQRTQMPAAANGLSARVQSALKDVASKSIRSKEHNASSSIKRDTNRKAGPKTSGVMTVMTGYNRSTTSVKGNPETDVEARMEKHKNEAMNFMKGLKEPVERQPFFNSSSEEDSVSSPGSGNLSVTLDQE